jgi:DNA-binding phage protein
MAKKMRNKILDADQDAFRGRLRKLVDQAGGVARFADSTGVKRPSVRKYLEGTDPSRSSLTKIVSTLGVDPYWLLTGALVPENTRTEIVPAIAGADSLEVSRGVDAVEVPVFNYEVYKHLLLEKFDFKNRDAAILALRSKHQQLASHSFDRKILETFFPAGLESIYCYTLDDHTMFPRIPEGSVLFLDVNSTKPTPGHTYLLRYDDEPIIRTIVHGDSHNSFSLKCSIDHYTIKIEKDELINLGCVIAEVVLDWGKLNEAIF